MAWAASSALTAPHIARHAASTTSPPTSPLPAPDSPSATSEAAPTNPAPPEAELPHQAATAVDPTAADQLKPAIIRRIPEPVLATDSPQDPVLADRNARLVLHHAAEPGDPLLCRLVERFGAVAVATAMLAGSAADLLSSHDVEFAADRVSLLERAHTLQTRCYRADPDADLAAARKIGARYVIPADPDWPSALADLGDSVPLGLWLLGDADLAAASTRGVSIVGARIATGYGTHVASEMAAGLADRGWAVISGAARGIDGAAHRGALAAHGTTVAVLACGIDLVYPRGHEALIGAIAADGLVVSELPPGTNVSRFRFLDRNRVIAALGRGTVVVEAASRSGSLVTARLADELGRPVLAMPGPVTSEASEGTHQLIRDGALLVTRAAEVVEHLGELGVDLAEQGSWDRSSSRRPRDALSPVDARVLDALPPEGRDALDTVEAALAAGLEPRVVHAALGRLSASGWALRDEKGWSARRRP
ncbi:DNA-processing protein DprA [Catenulispora yoronensis]|uniref:DNA-processing protein DprA n=2 Tax=Catenulispora yoronensis TaxID=450799 RepID=A0ABN2UQN4_9ACTN